MWLRRQWQLALGFGLGLGGAGQLAIGLFGRSAFEAPPLQRCAAWLYTAACLACLAHLYSLLTARWLHRPAARPLLLASSVAFWSVLGLVLMAGIVFRVASGTYLTAGVLMFTLNGSDAIAHAATGEYFRTAVLAALALVGFGALTYRLLRPALATVTRPRKRDLSLAAGLVACVGLLFARRADFRFTRGMFVSAPLLALASSFERDLDAPASSERALLPKAPPGPPRSAEDAWREAVGRGCHRGPCPRPNVVLFVLESLAPGHLGVLGYSRPTPALDRLLGESLFFTRAWTTATHSNYAQPAILSSLFPRRGHALDQYEELDYPRFLFHDLFHLLGYDTATISSQDEDWQGMRRFQNTGTPTFYWYADDYEGDALDSGVERTAPDEATTAEVLRWLALPREKPFALYVNFQGTHFPYTLSKGAPKPYLPDEPDWSQYTYLGYPESDREAVVNRYDNALAHVDRQVARVREALEAAGTLDNTLIVVTADHGELFFDREMVTHGRSLYDVEARVPIALRWPKRWPAERREAPASHLDVLPTIADALDVPAHPSWQGASLLAADAPARAVFLNIQGLRFADAVVCWPWKFLVDRTGKAPHLYQLADDPNEESDLVDAEPDVAAALADTLQQQLLAQLEYHHDDAGAVRRERFAPRLRACPALSARRAAMPAKGGH